MGRSYKKEFSKCCGRCGVEWLPDWSNKQEKRALCKKCFVEQTKENERKYRKGKTMQDRMAINAPLKVAARKEHWNKIKKEMESCNTREEWRKLISRNLEIALNDELIKHAINQDYISEFTKLKYD